MPLSTVTECMLSANARWTQTKPESTLLISSSSAVPSSNELEMIFDASNSLLPEGKLLLQ